MREFRLKMKIEEHTLIGLTRDEIDQLAGLCEAQALLHVITPQGTGDGAQAWRDLANRLRRGLK